MNTLDIKTPKKLQECGLMVGEKKNAMRAEDLKHIER